MTDLDTLSAYSSENLLALKPLTDVECAEAPQTGIHLFHFSQSLCSMKVRQALEENDVQWTSHHVLLPAYQQYEPDYVRMNPRCVVPTLVCDGKVTTDSANILNFINSKLSNLDASQKPSVDEFEAIAFWLDKADSLPIEALTYGDNRGSNKSFLFKSKFLDERASLFLSLIVLQELILDL